MKHNDGILVFESSCAVVQLSDRLSTVVPYGSIDQEDGNVNHGYIDLIGRPDLVESVPEVHGYPELGDILRFCNGQSPYFTVGCEKGFFKTEDSDLASTVPDYLGSYVNIAFRDLEKNTKEDICALAVRIANEIGDCPYAIWFDLVVERGGLFGADCHLLFARIQGYGPTQQEARRSWGYACQLFVKALQSSISA